MTASNQTFGIYIHWPFCAQKCPYCDFNSHVRFSGWDEDRFLAAYLRELDWVAGLPPPLRGRWPEGPGGGSPSANFPPPSLRDTSPSRGEVKVSSIFFGGGTPSLMKPQTVGAILDHIAKLWTVDADAEITLEANPGSVEAGRFMGYRAAGINRVSMGFQSLRDDELKKLGRVHTVAEAKAALEIARRTFERYSFDLIYARPGQTPQQWREELREALALANDHISLYQLTIEPDTPYAALHAAGKLIVPDPDAASELYEITQEMTAERGLAAYEISNHAKPGAESRHNLLYWRYGAYAGIGPGAHGRLLIASGASAPSGRLPAGESEGAHLGVSGDIPSSRRPPATARSGRLPAGESEGAHLGVSGDTPSSRRPPATAPSGQLPAGESEGANITRIATVAQKHPETWAGNVERNGHGFTELTPLTPAEQADEMLLMGLRLTEGVDLERLASIGGVHPSEAVISDLAALGLIERLDCDAGSTQAAWPRNELDEIKMCLGPGMAPDDEHKPARAPAKRIRATPRGRFVLNAVVAKLSESFQAVAASPGMDIGAGGH